ncbi:O-antigen ligase RfaL [Providencia vermicola]|uniref:O-antigen ligase RfaL n=1 Tax=Providencia TaxID=586 RepID=UPI00234ADC77|nr:MULTISPECIES: O-antigen ligase RfaL [Providencia]ELR5143982.1 O-antigen ligase RfaL [Providencia stuartii]WER22241.1 O-antigen ligase RfaL [Providencia stuartii]WER26362.1 O-antigen ligase RfaL [Providencia stuartii]WER30451.1 O-antigen ligase RfaL [Providencia stuartii]
MPFLERNQNTLSKYNKALIFMFVVLFFVDNVTRYKHVLFYLMIATSLVYLSLDTRRVLKRLNNKLLYLVVLFSLVFYISISYSSMPDVSMRAINNNFLNYGVLSLSLLLPILLYKENIKTISNLLLTSFSASLVFVLLIELYRYYEAYQNGILPFTTYNFRNVSDALVFYFPIIPILWYLLPKSKLIYFYILSVVFLFVLLGTLSRGGWVAVAMAGLLFLCFKRPWKLIGSILCISLISLTSLKSIYPDMTKTLFYKLEQTDSTYRYKNGTQGTALELILENPIIGYGFGDKTYIDKYNSVVLEKPDWVFKKSLGPHNIWLYIWFGVGISGLIAFSAVFLSMCFSLFKEIKSTVNESKSYFAFIALLMSLISFYLVRGMFEQVDLKPLGVLLGFLIAMMGHSSTKNKRKRYE